LSPVSCLISDSDIMLDVIKIRFDSDIMIDVT